MALDVRLGGGGLRDSTRPILSVDGCKAGTETSWIDAKVIAAVEVVVRRVSALTGLEGMAVALGCKVHALLWPRFIAVVCDGGHRLDTGGRIQHFARAMVRGCSLRRFISGSPRVPDHARRLEAITVPALTVSAPAYRRLRMASIVRRQSPSRLLSWGGSWARKITPRRQILQPVENRPVENPVNP